jgi:repressor of nif and glnA expression
MNKTLFSILKVLEGQTDIIGAKEISNQLRPHGIDLTERTVRYHLRILDERGLTRVYGKEGRRITEKGMEELVQSHVPEQVGFIISRIESLSYMMTLDINRLEGDIILNVSYIDRRYVKEAFRIMKPVFHSSYVMSDRIVLAEEGELIGDVTVPEGKVGIGTVCSVTINGIFIKSGIPITSRFGGVLQVKDTVPSRFTALISYEGSSLDPLEIFVRSNMTDVKGTVKHRSGRVLASFREIPVVSMPEARGLCEKMKEIGIGGVLAIGNPNQPLLEMPVGIDKAGMVIVGGLNPVAAIEESGIPTVSKVMSTLYEFTQMTSFKDALKRVTLSS